MVDIVLEEVQKIYPGGAVAVEGLSYTIRDGEFVTILGPSGCGKSTTLNMIAGLEDISSGRITIDGRRVDELPPDKRDLAFVFQDYALYPHMTVYQNMAFGLRMRKVDKRQIDQRVREAARRLSIEPFLNRRPRALSGGQRQRVALGRAIARRPSVFLFDEPLSNLDALLRDQTRTELKQLHRDLGATSVYVTHDQEEAMTLSDKIAVMSRGRLEQFATPEEVYRRPATEFVAGFVGKPKMNLFDVAASASRSTIAGTSLVIDAPMGSGLRVGFRPDEVRLSVVRDESSNGEVRLLEPVGHATDVHVAVGDQVIVARVAGFFDARIGEPVRVDLREAQLHFFERDTGKRAA